MIWLKYRWKWFETPFNVYWRENAHYSPLPNKPWFSCVCSMSLLKTVGKGEFVYNEQFILFPQYFLPFFRTFCHFHLIWNCHLQTLSVWKSLKFVIWERGIQGFLYICTCVYMHEFFIDSSPLGTFFIQSSTCTTLELSTTQSRLLKTLKRKPFENILRKGENAGNQHFLLFAQCFQRAYPFSRC